MSKYDAIPDELKEREQWMMWDSSAESPRRPHWKGDFRTVSWDDPDDWHSFEEAVSAATTRDSWGIGYVMALDNNDHARGLYGCLDLDGCLRDPDGRRGPKDWLPSLGTFLDHDAYAEYSASGEGIHIPLVGQERPDWWRDSHFSPDEHEGVEFLTNKFIAFTGDKMPESGDKVADTDPAPFLHEAFKIVNDESPVRQDSHDYDDSDHDDELSESQIRDALDNIDSSVPYPQWRDILFAIHDWDAGSSGKSVAEDWSMGPGWDDQAEELIQKIWRGAEQGSGITVGTLIHKATENGWSPGRDETSEPRTAGDGGSDVETAETDAETDASDADAEESLDWGAVYNGYRTATDADERLVHRYEATELLSENHHWRNVAETDILWSYDHDEGIFKADGEQRCRQVLVDNLREQFRAHEHSEVCTQLRGRTTVSETQMGGPADRIACANGVLDLETNPPALEDHAPEYEFLSALGTEYDPEASCPRFEQFLRETVPDSSDRLKLQEFAGYCLMHWQLPHHKGLFLVGPTASGKSTFLDTIRAMLGGDTTASLTPQQMTSERFGGAELYGAWANIRNDIPAQMIDNTGTFKELVAGDPVKAEKKFKDPFMFSPTAKHLFSANQLPEASTDDEAFYRRILLVAFPETIPRDERDPRLDDKLERELPGILNWALDGLERMRAEGGFSSDRSPGLTQQTWEKWCNSVKRFVQICVEEATDETLPKSDAYHAYRAFCDDEGIPVETQHKFTRDFKNYSGYEDGRTYAAGSGRDRIRVFFDCQLTGRGEEFLEDYSTSDDIDSATGDGGSGVTDF